MTTIRSMIDRGIIPEPANEAEWVRIRRERRAKNVANAREVLRENLVPFCELQDGDLVRFEIWTSNNDDCVIYYPEEGRWYKSGGVPGAFHYGVRKLVKFVRGLK